MNKLSCIVLTKDCESYLKTCLQNLKWVNELIVMDDYSSDSTVKIAKRFGAKIYKRNLNNNFAKQREFCLSKASNKWVLFVDSDEVVTKKLQKEIQSALKDPKFTSYRIPRKNIYLNKELQGGEWGKGNLTRLMKKGTGKWVRNVHEYWVSSDEKGQLNNYLLHHSPKSIQSFLGRLTYFPLIHASEKRKEKKAGEFWKILVFPVVKFARNYILRGGYKDGIHGFVLGMLLSFHSFLSWCYLWQEDR